MGAYLFLSFMALWLVAIGAGCVAARTRLRREEQTSAGRAALLVAMTRIPCTISAGSDKNRVDA